MAKFVKQTAFLWIVIALMVIYIASLKFTSYSTYNNKDKVVNNSVEVGQMNNIIYELRQQLISLKNAPCADKKTTGSNVFDRKIPGNRNLDRMDDILTTLTDFQRRVTVLIHSGDRSSECVIAQVKQIRDNLRNITIIVLITKPMANTDEVFTGVTFLNYNPTTTEGFALNKMISLVKTDYFLYLSRGDVISEYGSGSSPGWLYQALEKIPELDIVGGSFLVPNASLKYAQLVIQCHRLKLCYWTLKQSYEYKYSVGDMMVCEETSSTFMARTARVTKLGLFDESLQDMVTTDFFLRVKGKAVVGLMPEIYFHVSKTCATEELTKNAESLKKQSFMDKYSLRRIVDSFGKKIDYPNNPVSSKTKSVYPSMSYVRQGGVNYPQAQETLRLYNTFFAEFFLQHNITYIIIAGVALGGIKSRDALPWDTGDLDSAFYGIKWQKVHKMIEDYIVKKGVTFLLKPSDFGGGPPGVKCINAKLMPNYYGVDDDIYSYEYKPEPKPDELMYIFIYDSYIPVLRSMFVRFRDKRIYGIQYLKMQNHDGNLKCKVNGHHACVPEAFSLGGGHWSDFYCM